MNLPIYFEFLLPCRKDEKIFSIASPEQKEFMGVMNQIFKNNQNKANLKIFFDHTVIKSLYQIFKQTEFFADFLRDIQEIELEKL